MKKLNLATVIIGIVAGISIVKLLTTCSEIEQKTASDTHNMTAVTNIVGWSDSTFNIPKLEIYSATEHNIEFDGGYLNNYDMHDGVCISYSDAQNGGTFTLPDNAHVRILVIGGGGAGGTIGVRRENEIAYGGAAGGVSETTLNLPSGTYQIHVGTGGRSSDSYEESCSGNNGEFSAVVNSNGSHVAFAHGGKGGLSIDETQIPNKKIQTGYASDITGSCVHYAFPGYDGNKTDPAYVPQNGLTPGSGGDGAGKSGLGGTGADGIVIVKIIDLFDVVEVPNPFYDKAFQWASNATYAAIDISQAPLTYQNSIKSIDGITHVHCSIDENGNTNGLGQFSFAITLKDGYVWADEAKTNSMSKTFFWQID